MTDPRLLDWGLPGPAKVLAAARQRLEAGHGMAAALRVSLTDAERDQVGMLLGTSWVLSGRQVGARALAEAVASLGTDLETLLTVDGGPVRDRAAERAASVAGGRRRARALGVLTAAGVPTALAAAWVARRGLPRAGTGQLLELASRCALVWPRLPGPTVLLTVLAAEALGDPHALDRGSPVPRRAAAARVRRVRHRRGLAGHLGRDRSGLRPRLVPGPGPEPAAGRRRRGLPLTAAAGTEPLWLTWRSLAGTFGPGDTDVYACENPSVLIAAADQLGRRCLPLVCTNGRPSAAARRLLAALAAGGTVLHVRADEDSAGRQIVSGLNAVIPGMRLWRYSLDPSSNPRYEEQDLELLLHDLDRG